jgi:hypothetical protein
MAAEGNPLINGNFLISGENTETDAEDNFGMDGLNEPVNFRGAVENAVGHACSSAEWAAVGIASHQVKSEDRNSFFESFQTILVKSGACFF